MSKLRLIPYAVLTAGSMVAGGGAYAQSMYDINQRQDYQQNQIERGVRDGQITRSPAAKREGPGLGAAVVTQRLESG